MRNFIDKFRRFFWFNKFELYGFAITSLILGFVVSFNWWGEESFNAAVGFRNLLGGILLIALLLFIHHAGQRLWGLYKGFRVEQRIWWYGLFGSLLLVLVSSGNLKFLAASGTFIHLMPRHRFGRFKYGENLSEWAQVCLAGPVANIFAGGFIVTLSWLSLFPVGLADQFLMYSLVFAAWNLIPIPPLDGSRIMYYSRITYMFIFGTIGSYAFMVYYLDVYSYIFALLIGILTALIYYAIIEREL